MSKCQICQPTIAIVGGDGRDNALQVAANIRSYPSSQNGGNGRIRDATAAIKAGNIQLVLLLIRWLGHSEYKSLVNACKASGIRYVSIPKGSASVVQREVQEYLNTERS